MLKLCNVRKSYSSLTYILLKLGKCFKKYVTLTHQKNGRQHGNPSCPLVVVKSAFLLRYHHGDTNADTQLKLANNLINFKLLKQCNNISYPLNLTSTSSLSFQHGE